MVQARLLAFGIRLGLILTFVFSAGLGCTKSKESASTTQSPSETATAGATSFEGKTLNIYSWANYVSPEIIKRFEEKTKAKVVFTYFSSNEELLAKLQAGARGYDLIMPSGYLIKALKELELIEPLGKLDWPELNNLIPRFRSPEFDPNHEYTIPYAWGTTGLAVNKSKVKAKVDSLAWAFEHPELKGQITMLDDAPVVIGTALKYLGYSYNEIDQAALDKAKELLMKQKKLLKAYTAEAQPVLEAGEFAIAQAYSGDAIQVKKRLNPNVEYVLPKEGGEMYVDLLAIPKGAPSPELAKAFMRFSLDPEIALAQVQHLYFSPVVDVKGMPAAKPLLDNPAIFPSEEQLKKFEMADDNPVRMEKIHKLWTELKSM